MSEQDVVGLREDLRLLGTRLDTMTSRLDTVIVTVAKMQGETSTMKMMTQFIVLPLLIILGGLIGLKLMMPLG